jgi:hypothetical protein
MRPWRTPNPRCALALALGSIDCDRADTDIREGETSADAHSTPEATGSNPPVGRADGAIHPGADATLSPADARTGEPDGPEGNETDGAAPTADAVAAKSDARAASVDGNAPRPDAAGPAPDAHVAAPGAHVAALDGAPPSPDAAGPAPDAHVAASDAHAAVLDDAAPVPDAVGPAPDAGIVALDAAGPVADALGPAPDAGIVALDAAGPLPGAAGPAPEAEFAFDLPGEPTTALISAARGGLMPHRGASLLIPGGALVEDTVVSIDVAITDVSGLDVVGPVDTFGPAGLTFARPARISLPSWGADDRLTVWFTDANGVFAPLPTTVEGGLASAYVSHYSQGVVVRCSRVDCGPLSET